MIQLKIVLSIVLITLLIPIHYYFVWSNGTYLTTLFLPIAYATSSTFTLLRQRIIIAAGCVLDRNDPWVSANSQNPVFR